MNEMALQTNPSLLSTANVSQGFNHLDYDGDSIMGLTPIPESSLNNANAYGGPDSLDDAAWQELGSDYLSSMQGIYDATDYSDMLTSQLLPQPQMEVAWENSMSQEFRQNARILKATNIRQILAFRQLTRACGPSKLNTAHIKTPSMTTGRVTLWACHTRAMLW
jgi:hypothetical protein